MVRRIKSREFGKSINFTSTNGCTIPYLPSVSAFSVAFWAKKNSNGVVGRYIDYQDAGPTNGFTVVNASGAPTQVQFNVSGVNGSQAQSGDIPIGVWFHVAATFSTASAFTRLYINGILVSSGANLGTPMTASSQVVKIGNRATSTSAPLEGKMDDIYLFNRELNAVEIANLYYDGIDPLGASARYDCNDNMQDLTANTNNGTVSGATYTADVPKRNRVRIQGRTNSLNITQTTDLVNTGADYIGMGNITASAWIYPRAVNGNNVAAILHNTNGFTFFVGSNGRLRSSTQGTNADSANFAIQFNKWQHVLVTRSSTGATTLYINAQSTGALNQTTNTPIAGGNVIIGNRESGSNEFNGLISNVKVHNRILSQEEIIELFNTGRNAKDTSLIRHFTLDGHLNDTSSALGAAGVATGTAYSTNVPSADRALTVTRVNNRDLGTSLSFVGNSTNNASVPYTFPTDAYSVSFWIKQKASIAADQHMFYQAGSLEFYRQGTNDVQVYAYLNAPNDFAGLRRLRFRNFNWPSSTTTVGANFKIGWEFKTLVIYVESGSAKCDEYTNGIKVNSTHTVDYTGDTSTPSGNLIIGNFSGGSSNAGNMFMDDVRIFNSQLTATDVLNLYRFNINPSTPGAWWKFDEGSGTTVYDSSRNANNGTLTGATYSSDTAKKVRVLS